MRKLISSIGIGETAQISIHTEDKWIYPTVDLDVGNGEGVAIHLQHTGIDKLNKIGDAFKELAWKLKNLEETTSQKFEK